MEGNIAATYTLIYHFLKQQCNTKAAQAVKKAAKAVVVLRDDIEQEGPTLQDIIKTWKAKENTKSAGSSKSSSEESESSDDSDSSSGSEDDSGSDSSSEDDDTSDSDDGSDKLDEGIIKSPQKAAERDTSVTLSSAGDIASKAADKVAPIPVRQSTKSTDKPTKDEKTLKPESADTDGSDSDSSSENSDAESSSSSSGSSSDSDSSSEDEANKIEKAPTNRIKTTASKSPSTSGSSSESDDESESEPQQNEDTLVAKKRKTSETGAAVTTAVTTGLQQAAKVSQKKEKSSPAVKERFQRVKVNSLAPELLLDNGYEAKGGVSNDYGDRAHRDLIVTRGTGFRKEKNKKKRGSYRGGEITMENHSIKFDF